MSKSVGIVSEYNPFHSGHRYQIDFLKENGYEEIIVAMSGSRVQRGSLALLNKHTRAKMALENGVSLVAEIPYPFSSMSAEGYAMAGMQTLKALGVDAICFGSESGNGEMLKQIAAFLLTEEYENSLKKYLEQNLPFPAAREKAIFEKFGFNRNMATASNDILAVEYIKACIKLNWQPEIIALKRKGAAYNRTKEKDGFASASGIRKMINEYRFDSALTFIPQESIKTFEQAIDRGSYFSADVRWEKAVLFKLRQFSREKFETIPDCNSELAGSFEKAAAISNSFEMLFDNLPTKRYTRARLNRIILAAFLDIKDDMPKDIQYIRLLGFDHKGEQYLKEISKTCPLPVSHSVKILSEKSEECRKIAAAESRACDAQATFCKFSGEPRQDFINRLVKL
ncbi:MAG: nucleotidyltransferase family protein [Oscillospiraceae bacterium]|nr:nucleotidyltransferase family protein [Oscillospiraceae bacterium]